MHPSPANAMNGERHPNDSDSHRPSGSPAIDATENADMMTPMASPRRASGKASPTAASTTAAATPPNAPATVLAASNCQ